MPGETPLDSSLTEEAIREGFSNLKDQSEYQSLYEAGLSRAIGDWTLGMNATRLYTLKYAQGRQVLSIGRVQTPTLALIVNRQLEIENFKPEPYWVLTTNYRDTVFTAVLEQDEEETATASQEKVRTATEAARQTMWHAGDSPRKKKGGKPLNKSKTHRSRLRPSPRKTERKPLPACTT